jgi:hypothetical protein
MATRIKYIIKISLINSTPADLLLKFFKIGIIFLSLKYNCRGGGGVLTGKYPKFAFSHQEVALEQDS